jgi:nucleotide-binding universal stress UspA family protein
MIPPKRILAGVDFSDPSRTALAFAARLALHGDGHLDVLHAQDPVLTAAAHTARINLSAETTDELRRVIDETAPARLCQPDTLVVCGTPGTVLCNIAAREQVDVVVVGAHGMSGAARWLFGSNTERVLRHAAMSVLVVPSGWQPPRPELRDLSGLGPVIAAVDFSEPALAALHAAARLAAFFRTTLDVVHIVPELRVLDRWTPHADRAVEHAIQAAQAKFETYLAGFPVDVPMRFHVETGDIVESILRLARPETGSPLLVLGRRPHEAGESAPGTVVSRALASLQVPLLVVPPSEGVPSRG